MFLNCGAREGSWEFLGQQNIKPVNPKVSQPWIFTGRTDDEVEAQKLWPPDAKTQCFGKDLDAGKDWGWEENGMKGLDGGMASLTLWMWV